MLGSSKYTTTRSIASPPQTLQTEIKTVQEELERKTEALATTTSVSQGQIAELEVKLRKAEDEKSELPSLRKMQDELQQKYSQLRKEHAKVTVSAS
jgi:hypothetical protein